MDRREPPHTEEGWYALHDFRRIDWDAWSDAPERVRERALSGGIDHLRRHEDVADADEGATAVFSMLGHETDLLVLHLRPTTSHLDTAQRRFESTEFARFTERATSFFSVTEASGYSEKAREYFEGDGDADSGIGRYIQTRLEPSIPDAEHVCFYPMSKRRDPEYNWYDLPFEERAEHMQAHGDIGRDYAGKVVQMITGAVGFDDWEWGVTLYADDAVHVKDLLYEMRFDPSTSKYAEFGPFYFGRRIDPTDLRPLLAGQPVGHGTDDADGDAPPVHPDEAAGAADGEARASHPRASDGDAHAGDHGEAEARAGDARGAAEPDAHHGETPSQAGGDADSRGGAHPGSPAQGDHPHGENVEEADDLVQQVARFGVVEGEDYDAGDYGLVVYSDADAQDLVEEIDGLRENFDHYDTHVLTTVRADKGQAAVVSVWANERAADTAAGFLGELPGVEEIARGPLGEGDGDSAATGAGGDDAAAAGTGDQTTGTAEADDIRGELAELDIYAGQPHGEDVYAMVLYSEADSSELFAEVEELREGFDRYDTHEGTRVYESRGDGRSAVVSLWATRSAAEKAGDFLADLPGIVARAGERSGFGTMGMFYTVQSEYREEFVDTFDDVEELLTGMDGHLETELLVNSENDDDMFIASQWESKDDAMDFFRSDDFAETVEWGREVLADRPRHVFLA